jgi:hypothetical protein
MRRIGVVEERETSRIGSDSHRTPWYWLLSRYGVSRLEVFTEMTPRGEEIVPVFGSADATRAYLSDGAGPWNGPWKPRKTSRGELVSLLMGVCKDARWVALDPSPGVATAERVAVLRAYSREAFLDPLLGRGRSWFEATRHVGRKPAATARDPRSRERKKRPVGFGTAP